MKNTRTTVSCTVCNSIDMMEAIEANEPKLTRTPNVVGLKSQNHTTFHSITDLATADVLYPYFADRH